MSAGGDCVASVELSAARWGALIAQARQGDRNALGDVFQQVRAYLQARAREHLDDQLRVKTSPSDIVQETLLEAHRSFGTFHGKSRSELIVWLQAILTHRVKTARRRYRGTDKRDLAREVSLRDGDTSGAAIQLATASQSTPSGRAAQNEELARLEQALQELSTRHEQVIRLRNELKLSFVEVGEALGCSDDAAQKLWTRAIDALARNLNRPLST
jgi:RNA polymerase sigma-70 factor (ECF subfamily)